MSNLRYCDGNNDNFSPEQYVCVSMFVKNDKKSIGFRVGVFCVTFLSCKGQNAAAEMLEWIVDHGCVVPGEMGGCQKKNTLSLRSVF